MLMQLDFTSDVPIYRQIHDQLVLGIADGRLEAGEKLPAIRALANETGVNMMTINKAYQLLKQEGYITADRRGGTTVSGSNTRAAVENTLEGMRLHAASAKVSGMSKDEWLRLCGLAYDGKKDEEEEA